MATEAEGRIAELQYLREQTERIGRGLDAAHEAEKVRNSADLGSNRS